MPFPVEADPDDPQALEARRRAGERARSLQVQAVMERAADLLEASREARELKEKRAKVAEACRVLRDGLQVGVRTREIRAGVIEAHQAGTFDTREREKVEPEEAAPETEGPREE